MKLSLIVAQAQGGVIGANGGLPWHLPADLKRFKALTMGHHLIVGRKTYTSIGRPLPGRKMIVVSRDSTLELPGAEVVPTPALAVLLAAERGEAEAFVAGGGEIYRALLPQADRIYLTRVEIEVAGDTTFPAIDPERFHLVSREAHPADERHCYPYSFELYER